MMDRTRILLHAAALNALVGAFIGSDMAGSESFQFKAIHAHILVVGWLSLFAFAIFYKVFQIPKKSILSKIHVISSLAGAIGLPIGLWLYYLSPFPTPQVFNLLFLIITGTLLLISFTVFVLIVFLNSRVITED